MGAGGNKASPAAAQTGEPPMILWLPVLIVAVFALGAIAGAEWQRTRRPRRQAAHTLNAAGDGERP